MGRVRTQVATDRARGELEKVYREEGARLQRSLLLFSGDRDVADDAVAEAFAQALRRGNELRSPKAWVWRAAFRIAAGELKRRRGTTRPAGDGAYEDPEPAADPVAALRKLSPAQRSAIILHHYAGYPAGEVAGIIGSTAPAVFVHLSRGRRRLRELLEVTDD